MHVQFRVQTRSSFLSVFFYDPQFLKPSRVRILFQYSYYVLVAHDFRSKNVIDLENQKEQSSFV